MPPFPKAAAPSETPVSEILPTINVVLVEGRVVNYTRKPDDEFMQFVWFALRREKMQPVRDEETKKMEEILTTEQFEKWQKMQGERRSHRDGEKKKTDK